MDYLLIKEIYAPILTIGIAIIIYIIIKNIITETIKKITAERKKQKTILNLIKNILKYLIIIVVFVIILDIYGIDTSKIATGLGIIGIVVGFAIQDILKDFFAGISIIIDNQYAIGDYVEINGFLGNVISLGLRSTKIKNGYGEIKIISSRNILEVTNYSLNNSILLLDLNVSNDADFNEVEEIIEKSLIEVKKIENVLNNPQVLGIDKIDNLSTVYKIRIECTTMKHFAVKRQVYEIFKLNFSEKNIKIFFSQVEARYGK